MADELPGLDLARLRRFLDDRSPGLVGGDLTGTIIAGGRSNLTYDVTDGERSFVVRRPPLGHVLATAHDMAREHTVITALRPTDVPVPQTYALCEDPDVIGAPFYVMEKMAGTPYRLARELDRLGPERTRAIVLRMMDVLSTLHQVDPASVGLSDFGRPDGFLERQVQRWKKQLDGSRTRELPGADELYRELQAVVPAQSLTAVIHGDYRLDNLVIDHDEVSAVLDWEMATLGDPLTDVGLLLVYQGRSGPAEVSNASSAAGYPSDDDLLDRYASTSGRDLYAMGFYLGLAYFKLAAILEGIHYRHTRGQTVGAGFDTIGAAVVPLIQAGRAALKGTR